MGNMVPVWGKRCGVVVDLKKMHVASVVVLLASACGGNSKDRTRETNNEADGSADAGQNAAGGSLDASPLDGAQLDASPLGTSPLGTSQATAETNGWSNTGAATLTSGVSTAPTTTGSTATTTDGSDTGLPPGWVTVEPIVEGFTECRAKPQSNDEWCLYDAVCDGLAFTSRCVQQAGDVWECTCQEGALPVREYVLSGVEGSSGCEASASLCAPIRRSEPDAVCAIENEVVSDYDCSAAQYCRTTVELEADVTAVVTTKTAYSDCSRNSANEAMNCACRDLDGPFGVYEIPFEEACKLVVPWCNSGLPVADEAAEETCTLSTKQSADTYCSINRQCGSRLDLADGYVVLDQATKSVGCSEGSGCDCVSGDYITARASGAFSEEQCDVMEEYCFGGVTPVPAGVVDISSVETSGSDISCTSVAIGEQLAAWGEGKAVGLTGSIVARCSRAEGDTWDCTCESGTNETDGFVVEGETFEESCEAALEDCVARAQIVATVPDEYPYEHSFEFLAEPIPSDAGL